MRGRLLAFILLAVGPALSACRNGTTIPESSPAADLCLAASDLSKTVEIDIGQDEAALIPEELVVKVSGRGTKRDVALVLPVGGERDDGCLELVDARLHPNQLSSVERIRTRSPLQLAETPVFAFEGLTDAEVFALFDGAGDRAESGRYTLAELVPAREASGKLKSRDWPGREAAIMSYIDDRYAPEADSHVGTYDLDFRVIGIFDGQIPVAYFETRKNDFGTGIHIPIGTTHTLSVAVDIERALAIAFMLEGEKSSWVPPPTPEVRKAGWLSRLEFEPGVEEILAAASAYIE